jgi:hypothetical protein
VTFQRAAQNFLLIGFWRFFSIIFQRQKVIKNSQNSGYQGFSFYFCLMIEGSGDISVPCANGSGSAALVMGIGIHEHQREFFVGYDFELLGLM